jgi:outer membrane protein OmpA-like peptidoglycan-associated protein
VAEGGRSAAEVDAMRARGSLLSYLLLLALTLAGATAHAQRGGGPIDLQLFRPAIDSKGYFTLNSSQVLRHLDISFGLVVNWAMNPLKLSGPTFKQDPPWCDNSLGTCVAGGANVIPSRYDVENLVTGNLQAAIGLFKHFEVGLGLPITIWNGDTDPNPNIDNAGKIDAQGVGDLALHLKGRILNTSRHPIGLGAVLSLTFPTGDKEKFLGTGRVGIHPTLLVDKEFAEGRISLALNVGARIMTGSDKWVDDQRACSLQTGGGTGNCSMLDPSTGAFRMIERGSHLTYGIGAAFYLVPQRLSFVAELIGQTGFKDFAKASALNSAHEILAGFKLYLARNSYFAVGAGRGLRGGGDNYQYGSPDVRVFAAFIFEPSIGDRDGDGIKDDVDKCPDDPEDLDDFEDEDGCPDPDNDRDGIPDRDDKCPNEPENYNGFEDKDGCPDSVVMDRDGDGIPDDKDKCPDDPEDKDGFEDEDGCPDPDNDKDGILDVDDLCPNDPEDKDGFEDEDGCPDPDNDKDRILDKDDKCPNEPETYNGHEDEDGCPDKGRVVVHKGRIEILDKIYFETDKAIIKPVSFPILDAIAATLKGNPQILLVEIQGHADERGSDDHNMKLTDDRAHAVQKYIIDKGIESGRLKAKGYGETRPVDKNHNEEAWSKNRRVEFVIQKRAD